MTGLRAIMVAVDYSDLLAVTLPRMRKHFDEVHIVTDIKSIGEVGIAVLECGAGPVEVWATDLFYANGAKFNKWRALEWGLDRMGRHGWMCLLDADVIWPSDVQVTEYGQSLRFGHPKGDLILNRGELMSPLRRMAPWPITGYQEARQVSGPRLAELIIKPERADEAMFKKFWIAPPEKVWGNYPVHRNVNEWAGYTQVFHASDPHLPAPPWHQTDWTHAGGADSFFQQLWPREAKRRPPWECLHLGDAGLNWYGRATTRGDGTEPEEGKERKAACAEIWRGRRELEAQGQTGDLRFAREKIG